MGPGSERDLAAHQADETPQRRVNHRVNCILVSVGRGVSAHTAGRTRERIALADVDIGAEKVSRASRAMASIATDRVDGRRDAVIIAPSGIIRWFRSF
jgi:hypothetical protein